MDRLSILLATFLLSACAQEGGNAVSQGTSHNTAQGAPTTSAPPETSTQSRSMDAPVMPFLARLPAHEAGDAAAFTGILVVDGPCIYAGEGASRVLIATMTSELDWDIKQGVLRLSDGGLARVGERVLLGGSQARGATVQALPWLVRPSKTCDQARVWITSSAVRAP